MSVGTAQVLERCRAEGRAALIGYLPVGFPDLETSIAAMVTLVENGCDIVEVGLPYSDPVIDGPANQRAVAQALAGGTRVADVFEATRAVRAAGAPPMVMTYWNLVLRRGIDRFADELRDAGGAGLITPDLIPDEAGDWIAASDAHGLERVFLVAPSSTPARLASTSAACRGWVYAASLMGVTGVKAVSAGARGLVERTRAAGAERVCVGLGVSTPAQAAEVAEYADGVIVGSAFVKALAEAPSPAEGFDAVRELARALAAACAGGSG